MNTLKDCDSCKIYPCAVQKQPGAEKEDKGSCPAYKTDLDKLIIEQTNQFIEQQNLSYLKL